MKYLIIITLFLSSAAIAETEDEKQTRLWKEFAEANPPRQFFKFYCTNGDVWVTLDTNGRIQHSAFPVITNAWYRVNGFRHEWNWGLQPDGGYHYRFIIDGKLDGYHWDFSENKGSVMQSLNTDCVNDTKKETK